MSAESTEAIWQHLFALFDRDHSGLLDEADVAAAIRSTGTSEDLTRRALAGVSAGGRVEPARFRELLEQHIDAAIGRGADAAAGRPKGARVRYYLGVLRDFERRATARSGFGVQWLVSYVHSVVSVRARAPLHARGCGFGLLQVDGRVASSLAHIRPTPRGS